MTEARQGVTGFNAMVGAGVFSTPIGMLDEQIMAAERTKIGLSIKKLYSTYISQALSAKIHTTVMVGVDSTQSTHLDRDVIGGKNLLEETADIYQHGRESKTYRAMRKMADMGRAKVTKNLAAHLTTPLGFIPDGGISKMVASAALAVMNQGKAIRRSRKLKHYINDKKDVAEQIGDVEAQRKSAKWSSKTLGGVGGDLQRNLCKLKQSVQVLQSREQSTRQRIDMMNAHSHNHLGSHELSQIRSSLADLSMSFHESLHYVEKVTNMCTLLDAASCEIKAHMDNMLILLEETESTLMTQGDAFFR